MEGTHGKLRSWFADGLCGNNTASFTAFHQSASGQVTTVAELANTALGFAGEYGTDLYPFNTGCLNGGGQLFGDFLVHLYNHVVLKVELGFKSYAAHNTVAQRLNDFA